MVKRKDKIIKENDKERQINIQKEESQKKSSKNIEKSKNYINISKKNIYLATGIIGIIFVIVAIFFFMKIPHSNGVDSVCSIDGACNVVPAAGNAVKNVNGDVVVEFNGEKIYSDELDKTYDMTFFIQGIPKSYSSLIPKKKVLNQTIMQELIYNEAIDNGFKATKEETEKKLTDALSQKGMSLAQFKARFENESFDYDYFIEYNRKNIAISKYINSKIFSDININEKDALDYYNTHKDQFKVDEQINVSHILVNTSEEAEEIIKELDAGKDFAELAKEKSIGPSAPNGGNLGVFSKGQMVPEFEDAAFALEEMGDYTREPVKTQYGYHIIKLNGKQDARNLSFDEVKEQIEKGLLQQKQNEVLGKYIDNLFKDANVKIYIKDEVPTSNTQSEIEVDKSNKPKIELFVMSYCPYGTQMEKGILPVAELLGDKIDFEIKFVNYAMHGEKEITENTRQYCIQKEQKDKYISYLDCFLHDGDSTSCLKQGAIDTGKLDSCMEATDKEYSITENLNNKQGTYPAFLIHDADNKKYGVKGSPTLVLNGKTTSVGRDSAGLLKSICNAFSERPGECNEQLSSEQPSPGFGFQTTTDSSSGGCGV